MKIKLITTLLLSIPIFLNANNNNTTIDSVKQEYINWYNKDFADNNIMGASVDKAYQNLLKDLTPKKEIIVAVIDGGVDINHEDFKDKIWINEDEIPNNGIDDDHNGYIDDINGWNFLGSLTGENITHENYEFVRIVRQFQAKYDTVLDTTGYTNIQREEYELYFKANNKYNLALIDTESDLEYVNELIFKLDSIRSIIDTIIPIEKQTIDLISEIKTTDKRIKKAKRKLLMLHKFGISTESLLEYKEHLNEKLEYSYNIDFDARKIINDDENYAFYGNNKVGAENPTHGTFVAGIIAANRNNNIGIDGIANNVKIMALRSVPDGDERDKDIALSIKYAVDNGAHIINMSFGKDFSPNKKYVDMAIRYAERQGVLLVHSAGNNSSNNDAIMNYPHFTLKTGHFVKNWITVGASSKNADKSLPGDFSNYGKHTVDLFAPGVDIVSLYPNNKYHTANGTSFSCPVVSGVAALVWSYYPELTALELKDILLKTTTKFNKKVYLPKERGKKTKVRFTELSRTGGIVNAYEALKLAKEIVENK